MAGLWIPTPSGEWTMAALDGGVVQLVGERLLPQPVQKGSKSVRRTIPELRRCWLSGNESWFLLVPHGVIAWVNGRQVLSHARLLKDHDSVRCAGTATIFFSAESLAQTDQFPGRDEAVYCPRCTLEVQRGQLACQCPACGLIHHQDPGVELECWSYGDTCAGCNQSTDPEAGYRWSPADAGA